MRRFLTWALAGSAAVFVVAGGSSPRRAAAEESPVTFSNQVVRVLQRQCQTCHRPGGVAPFSLLSYRDTVTHAEQILQQTGARYMPPWQPRPDCGGGFVNERRLTDDEIAMFRHWYEAGVPEGDAAQMPAPLVFSDDWQGTEPDVVFVNAAEGFEVPKDREHDVFRCFSLPTNFPVDRFVTGFEILPGKGVYVHHALIYLDVDGKSVELDAKAPGPGYDNLSGPGFDAPLIGGWNPGARPVNLPDGIGVRIPAGAHLVLQVHYASVDHVQVDRTYLGLRLARKPVRQARYTIIPKNEHFVIPAGDSRYEVDAEVTLPENVTLSSIAPHMHKIGKDMQVTAELPNGEVKCLVGVNWDINWQGTYIYKNFVSLPAGTRVKVRAFYDNSDENEHNPNHPPIDIPWYPEENKEMCFCTLGVTMDGESLPVSSPRAIYASTRSGSLVVAAGDAQPGAFLVVNGKIARDTARLESGALRSREDWQRAPGGETIRVAVLNPDGAMSGEVIADRR